MSNLALNLESTYDASRGFYVDVNLGNYPFMILCFDKRKKLVCALPNSKFISNDGSRMINAQEYNNIPLFSKTNNSGVDYKVIDAETLRLKDLVVCKDNVVSVRFNQSYSSVKLEENNSNSEEINNNTEFTNSDNTKEEVEVKSTDDVEINNSEELKSEYEKTRLRRVVNKDGEIRKESNPSEQVKKSSSFSSSL